MFHYHRLMLLRDTRKNSFWIHTVWQSEHATELQCSSVLTQVELQLWWARLLIATRSCVTWLFCDCNFRSMPGSRSEIGPRYKVRRVQAKRFEKRNVRFFPWSFPVFTPTIYSLIINEGTPWSVRCNKMEKDKVILSCLRLFLTISNLLVKSSPRAGVIEDESGTKFVTKRGHNTDSICSCKEEKKERISLNNLLQNCVLTLRLKSRRQEM